MVRTIKFELLTRILILSNLISRHLLFCVLCNSSVSIFIVVFNISK